MIKKVKIPQLKESDFLIVPTPLPQELFSSWFIRTAYAHQTHPHTFENLYLALPKKLFSKDIDVSIDQDTMQCIEKKCRFTVDLSQLTMQSYDTYLQERVIPNGQNKYITTLRYCPECLREDKVPYFRKTWKILFSTLCMEHHCFLHERCPKCMRSLDISKMYKNKHPFTSCHYCGFDLKKTRRKPIPRSYMMYIEPTKTLMEILNKGYISLNGTPVYSFYFFDALAQLSKTILIHKALKRIDHYLPKKICLKWRSQIFTPQTAASRQIPLAEQFVLYSSIMMLFQKYPQTYRSFLLENQLSHWRSLKDMGYVSYWFDELINSTTPRSVHRVKFITSEEIEAAKRYLSSQFMIINKANLTRLLGCNFFSSYNHLEV